MKLKFIYTFLGAAFLAFMLIGNAGGRAAGAGNGNTGSPADQTNADGSSLTCVNCHNNNGNPDLPVSLDIDVLDANNNSIASEGYTPGETYTVKVMVNPLQGATPAAYGFQLSCVNAPTDVAGDEVATWNDIADNVRVVQAAVNGRTYAEHDNPSQSNEFLVEWTAPSASSGTVTFYSCGNGVNLNNNRTGDGGACSTLELAEVGGSATIDFEKEIAELDIYPNPVRETLSLTINNKVAGYFTMTITDMSGRVLKSEQLQLFTGEQTQTFDVSNLVEGHYSVQILNQDGGISKKMLKL